MDPDSNAKIAQAPLLLRTSLSLDLKNVFLYFSLQSAKPHATNSCCTLLTISAANKPLNKHFGINKHLERSWSDNVF